LRSKRAELLHVNSSHYDRGLLYRLDFETSGVLVYLKVDTDLKKIRSEFNLIVKKKIYHCLVHGECKLEGSFTHYFDAREVKGRRVIVSDNPITNQSGNFELKPLRFDRERDLTLMEVELKLDFDTRSERS